MISGFHSQRASNEENVSICWRHHVWHQDDTLVMIYQSICHFQGSLGTWSIGPPGCVGWSFNLFKCHHQGCLNNLIFFNLELCVECWVHFVCHNKSVKSSKPVSMALNERNPVLTSDSPHKRPVKQKIFTYHNAVMLCVGITPTKCSAMKMPLLQNEIVIHVYGFSVACQGSNFIKQIGCEADVVSAAEIMASVH